MAQQENQSTEETTKKCPISCKNILRCLCRLWKGFSLFALVFVCVAVIYAGFRFLPDHTQSFDTMEDHFKYGSTGGDRVTGIPYWMWQAMPLVCNDTLKEIAGDRLAPDYKKRVLDYKTGVDGVPQEERRALSREGFKALGFLYENDSFGHEKDLPIGVSNRHTVGMDRVYINCAVCHTSRVRKSEQSQGRIVVGMPANLFNLYDFEQFVFQCAKNAGKTRIAALDYLPQIDSLGGNLDLIDQYIVYPLAIWVIRDAVMFIENVAGFSIRQPKWGPGRNDTFTNNKIFLYSYPWRDILPDYYATLDENGIGKVDEEGIGIVDWPSIWLQGLRKTRSDGKTMQLHWDGNNDKVEERNLNAALATSALPPAIDHESIECIEKWLETFEPPKYMFPIDQQMAERGKQHYMKYCANCHGKSGRDFGGEKVGFVTPIGDLNTDPYRLNNYTEKLAVNMAATYANQEREQREHKCPGNITYVPPERKKSDSRRATPSERRMNAVEYEEDTYRYKNYRKTYGYANMPLDGIWLRAPYLHNGSVPNLRELLEPEKDRSKKFYRGNDLYDPVNVGFVADMDMDAKGRKYFEYRVDVPGNSNSGHDTADYGIELSDEYKEELLEYLKTF